MDTDNHSSIDFANSKSDSYKAVTNEDIISELNSYFKSYIAGVSGESQQNVSNNLSFDDAMDSINSNRADNIERTLDVKPFDADESEGEDNDEPATVSSQMLDVELLEQHIDKANLSGGNDATRVIENMAGGGLNNPTDLETTVNEDEVDEMFEDNMLGGGTIGQTNKAGAMSGYSGVTDEIRIKGKRVTERNRNNIAYRSETGRLDMGMLGGSFEDMEEKDDIEEELMKDATEGEVSKDVVDNDEYDNEYEYDDYDNEYEVEHDDIETDEQVSHNMASEIDMVLNQLRNKTGRTLTGGSVNIRKKVVLTDMYPYIIRS